MQRFSQVSAYAPAFRARLLDCLPPSPRAVCVRTPVWQLPGHLALT